MVSVSVIMACRNGAATLGEALASLLAQEADLDWEIVLADNGSTDATRAVFEDVARRHPERVMRVVDASARTGKPHALNRGIREAKGDRILFLDDDDAVAPGWLAAMARALEDHDFVACRFDLHRFNPDWLLAMRRNPQETGLGYLPYGPRCLYAGGASLGFRRHVFEMVGGFAEDLPALEDDDFCIRAHAAGFTLSYVSEAVYHYRFRTDPAAMYRQSYAYAYARALLRRRYPAPGDPGRFALGPWFARLGALARLERQRVVRALRRISVPPEVVARTTRRLGALRGDLHGSLVHGVAPMSPRADAQVPALGQGAARQTWFAGRVTRRLLASFAAGTVSVRTKAQAIALTFDDGPDPATTPVLLDLLARHGARATFFLVGARAARHPELVARIAAEGHEIGNHSWDHPSLPTLDAAGQADQISRTAAVLAPHGGRLMRPPYGDQTFRTHRIARRLGCRVVLWSVNGGDWRGEDADTLAERLIARVGPGAIVLLHDSLQSFEDPAFRDRAPTFAAVERLIAARPGWRFVTVSELLALGQPIERVAFKTSDAAWLDGLGAVPDGKGAPDAPPDPAPGASPVPFPADRPRRAAPPRSAAPARASRPARDRA
jgi:peptidoglycan/xylan/chitin deacetylase (PgdA/CDA1 family)/glycosyltransferase involved in cell wall biosynthesis